MNVTNTTLVDAVPVLNQLVDLSLPIKTAFKIAKITKALQPALDSYNEVLGRLQQEHSIKGEDGSPLLEETADPNIKKIVFHDREAFDKAYQELSLIENKFRLEKLSIEEFGDVDITPASLFKIAFLIDDLD